jgi:hypothetical protein
MHARPPFGEWPLVHVSLRHAARISGQSSRRVGDDAVRDAIRLAGIAGRSLFRDAVRQWAYGQIEMSYIGG